MAEGGRNLSYSQLNAGDSFHELCCTRCAKDRRNKPSIKYCTVCNEYFCGQCLENHNSFQAMKDHTMVDTFISEQSSSTAVDKLLAVPTELCQHHPMKVVDMYCRSENVVGCNVCFNLNHKSCNDIHYIPKFVKENKQHAKQIDQFRKQLPKAVKCVNDMKLNVDSNDIELSNSKAECKKEINDYRKEINNIIDDIEKRSLSELDDKFEKLKQSGIARNSKVKTMKSNLMRYQDDLASEQVNVAQKFVLAIIGQGLIKESKKMKSTSSEKLPPTIIFKRNVDILSFLLNVLTLGLISSPGHQDIMETSSRDKQTSQPTSSPTKPTTTGATRSSIGTGNVRKVSQKSKKQGLYKVVNQYEYNIRQSDDIHRCSIGSSCIIDDSYIVLADYSNNKLKLVDSKTYNIISSLVLDAAPRSVCRIESGGVVVCLDNKMIQFLSYKDKLAVTRTLSMDHICRCITVSTKSMFISSLSELHIYNLQGKSLKSFTEIQSGNKTFSNICDVSISDDHSMIHIVDWDSGVITLDMNGKICWEFSDKVLSRAIGVCTDGSGNVLVCGEASLTVTMLSQGGDYIGEIVTQKDGLRRPYTVCYDKNRNTLIVGSWNNTIKVFFLQ